MVTDESVKELYDLAKSSVRARVTMDDAVKRGLTTTYHRTLRMHPEAQIQKPLLHVRGQLSRLARERRAVGEDAIQSSQVNRAMRQIAAGAMRWAQKRINPQPVQPPAAPEPTEPMAPEDATAL